MATPTVSVLQAITPANSRSGEYSFVYPDIDRASDTHARYNAARWHEFESALQGDFEEESAARQLAAEYLVKSAGRLIVTPLGGGRELWAARFTQASSEIYGIPETQEAAAILSEQNNELEAAVKNGLPETEYSEYLQDMYDSLLYLQPQDLERTPGKETADRIAKDYREVLLDRYGYVFDEVAQAGLGSFSPNDLRQLFETMRQKMIEHSEPGWEDWQIKLVPGKIVQVPAGKHEITIGRDRANASRVTARNLTAHELLFHALCANNGFVRGDELSATGLPGYTNTHEGTGKFAEHAISGTLPVTSMDHYADAAIALGLLNGRQYNRHQLYQFVLARNIVRMQIKGGVDRRGYDRAQKSAHIHVDSLFYGTPGDALLGEQGVFTKNTEYYGGYRKVVGYMAMSLAKGKTMREVFDYLTIGKFDPTNAAHEAYMKEQSNE